MCRVKFEQEAVLLAESAVPGSTFFAFVSVFVTNRSVKS